MLIDHLIKLTNQEALTLATDFDFAEFRKFLIYTVLTKSKFVIKVPRKAELRVLLACICNSGYSTYDPGSAARWWHCYCFVAWRRNKWNSWQVYNCTAFTSHCLLFLFNINDARFSHMTSHYVIDDYGIGYLLFFF